MFRRVTALIVGILAAASLTAACSGSDPGDRGDLGEPEPIAEARPGGSTPGSLLSAVELRGVDPAVAQAGIRAALITYRSTDAATGAGTVVTGTAFIPARDAPREGWRVVALGHGSTGIDPNCAPSRSATLADQVGLVIRLVQLGVVVTMTDYQGLGSAGIHPYLDSATAGLNVIDSVRAVRSTFTDVSNRWGALGGSQGGAAVWAANEEAASYAPDLDLVGVIALAPAADVVGLVDKAVARTLTEDQRPALQWVLESLSRLHPNLDLNHYRRGVAAANWDLLSSCAGKEAKASARIGPDDLTPDSPQAAAVIKAYLTGWALPRAALSAPMLVGYGAKDTFIDPAWTTTALAKACRLGGVIQARLDPEGTHASMDAGDPVQWLADRFAGVPAQNDCPPA